MGNSPQMKQLYIILSCWDISIKFDIFVTVSSLKLFITSDLEVISLGAFVCLCVFVFVFTPKLMNINLYEIFYVGTALLPIIATRK